MKKLTTLLSVCVLLSWCAAPSFADAVISFSAGPATVQRGGQALEAKKGMALAENDAVITQDNARVALLVDGTSRVWVAPRSHMEIASLAQGSVWKLLAGKIRAQVKLLSGKKFRVNTPVSVCSVRGTFWYVGHSEGKTEVAVTEGAVNVTDQGGGDGVDVLANQMNEVRQTGITAPREMTSAERAALENEWANFESQGQGGGGGSGQQQQQQTENNEQREQREQIASLRAELNDIVNQVKTELNSNRDRNNELKDTDFATARTLRDVHGNLVRVEQHLLRPNDSTLQFLNITKRSEYTYSNRQGWNFSVPTGSRLDIMDVTVTMNMSLPNQVVEWPAYIAAKGDDMHPDRVTVRMSNQADEVRMEGTWTAKGGRDEKGNVLKDDEVVFNSYINGWLVDPNYTKPGDTDLNFPTDGAEPTDLYAWTISKELRLTKNGQADKYVRLYSEGYAINNEGSILTLNGLLKSGKDPMTILRESAVEQIVFCRETDAAKTDFFQKGNLDLVYTPDLIISIATKLATQIDDLTSESDK